MATKKRARRKATSKATDPTAADSYNAHLRAIATLLLDTMHHVNVLQEEARGRKVGQTEVAGMERAREFTVEAAWALGAITPAAAKAEHGVVL